VTNRDKAAATPTGLQPFKNSAFAACRSRSCTYEAPRARRPDESDVEPDAEVTGSVTGQIDIVRNCRIRVV